MKELQSYLKPMLDEIRQALAHLPHACEDKDEYRDNLDAILEGIISQEDIISLLLMDSGILNVEVGDSDEVITTCQEAWIHAREVIFASSPAGQNPGNKYFDRKKEDAKKKKTDIIPDIDKISCRGVVMTNLVCAAFVFGFSLSVIPSGLLRSKRWMGAFSQCILTKGVMSWFCDKPVEVTFFPACKEKGLSLRARKSL